MQISKRSLLSGKLTLIFVLFLLVASAQNQTARYTSVIGNSHGFYEHLPADYSSGSNTYPLIIFIHGLGELGNGTSNLPSVMNNGIPRLLRDNKWPASFNVNGHSYDFIVISPQFVVWPSSEDILGFIDYAQKTYRVDPSRIYVTGLSMGGGVTWEFAGKYGDRIAAIVPVCGARYPDNSIAKSIADANVFVWATHNEKDGTVPLFYSVDFVNYINSYKPLAKLSRFDAGDGDHDAWTKTYNPDFRENGLNVYEWMLTHTRTSTDVPLPIILQDFTATLSGQNVLLKWTTSMEQNNDFFKIESSSDGTQFTSLAQIAAKNLNTGSTYSYVDAAPKQGLNYYRLSQTDKDGKTVSFKIISVQVGSAPGAGLKLYPNPAISQLDVTLNNKEIGQLTLSIISNDGRVIETMNFNKTLSLWNQKVNVAGLRPGYYFLKINLGSTVFNTKFIKQ